MTLDRQPAPRPDALRVWISDPRMQRTIGTADIVMAVLMLASAIWLESAGYPQSGPFGVGPFWLLPAVMLALGAALMRGIGTIRPRS
jgi:hypothetical protein